MKGFRVAHLNIRSLVPKIDDFRGVILREDYDVVAVSETWLNDDTDSQLISITGYRFVRQDRISRGGGVGIYVKDTISIQGLSVERCDGFEQVWVKFIIKKKTFIIGCIYRPPGYNVAAFLENFESALSELCPQCDNIICVGDFNINLFDVHSKYVSDLYRVLESTNLTQLINASTRDTAHSSTLLDLIMVDKDMGTQSSGTLHVPSLSDHDLVHCELNFPGVHKKVLTREYRDYKNMNGQQFYADLQAIPWRGVYELGDIDEKVEFFNSCIGSLLDIHAPRRLARFSRSNEPWLTDSIRAAIHMRDKALLRYKRSRKVQHWEYYKSLRNQTTLMIRREKKVFFERQFQNGIDSWKKLKRFGVINSKQSSEIPEDLKKPDELIKFFTEAVNVPLSVDSSTLNLYKSNVSDCTIAPFCFAEVDEITVLKAITGIKSGSEGVDGISIYILKLCCPFILPFITHIINYCILHSVFPKCWKEALIVPLPKVPTPREYRDLRPISILSSVSKVLEKIINQQLSDFVENNDILPECQSGFRRGHGCSAALTNVTDDILRAADDGKVTALALLDFTKAFDTIDHELLLAILHFVGLGDGAVRFFENFLSQRTQCVKIGSQISAAVELIRGVPQGSVPSALLYAIYTSRLPRALNKCSAQYYADDTQVYLSFVSGDAVESSKVLSEEIESLRIMALEHSLLLNANKSSLLVLGPKSQVVRVKNLVSVEVDGVKLPVKETARNLGVTFDSFLRFGSHVTECIKRAYIKIKYIYKIRKFISRKLKILLCDSLVLSMFNHCDVVYGNCLSYYDKKRIQMIQNACLRLIYGVRKFESVSPRLREAGWLSMEERRKLHCACFYRDIVFFQRPPYLYKKIIFRTHVHNLNIRFRGKITPPYHKTSIFERGFSFNIARFFNSHPESLMKLSRAAFRKCYKEIIVNANIT